MPPQPPIETAAFLHNPVSSRGTPERRRWVRSSLDVRVRVKLERVRTAQPCYCRSTDISEGGIGLFAPYEIEAGQVADIEFSLPGTATPLRIRAVVRSRAGYRYGLEFLSLANGQRREIVHFQFRSSPIP